MQEMKSRWRKIVGVQQAKNTILQPKLAYPDQETTTAERNEYINNKKELIMLNKP